MEVLPDLFRIKKFREDKAELHLVKVRKLLTMAIEERDQAQKTLDDYEIYRKKQEAELFKNLYSRLVKIKDINEVSEDIKIMQDEVEKLSDVLSQMQEKLAKAKEAVEEAKGLHQEAIRMREKYSEALKIMAEEELITMQLSEELGMEESFVLPNNQNDYFKFSIDGVHG
jgi:type III secretion protein O